MVHHDKRFISRRWLENTSASADVIQPCCVQSKIKIKAPWHVMLFLWQKMQ